MTAINKIKEQFINAGYVELSKSKIPKSLLWQPDLIFFKRDYTYLVLVKSNNSILPSFLNRISNIPKGNIIPLIVFAQKLGTKTEEKEILKLGISVGYFIRGKLSDVIIKKKRPQIAVKKEINKKLRVIDIFVSSKQDINEREFIKNRINFLRDANPYPFNPPHLIEYDKFNMNEVYKRIDKVIGICEWVVILLEDNYSDYVSYEINKSIKDKKHENIFMFVKSTNLCHTTWKKELNNVQKLNTIHYITYTNLKDLDISFFRAIRDRMNEIYKKEKIERFE
jgi:hypothetical protein